METKTILCNEYATVQSFVRGNMIKDHEALLIRVHTCIHSYKTIQPFLRELRKDFPLAAIIGGNHMAVISQGSIIPNTCLVSFTTFNNTTLSIHTFDTTDKDGIALASEVQTNHSFKDAKAALLFFTRSYTNIAEFIEASSCFCKGVKFCGGVTSNNTMNTEEERISFVICNDQVLLNGMVLCSIHNPSLFTYSNAIVGNEQIGQTYTITKSDGCIIEEIDDKDASSWYRGLLNKEEFEKDPSISMEFPFILPQRNNSVRVILYDADTKKISWVDKIPKNEQIRLGFSSPDLIIKECRTICQDISNHPGESLFAYSCFVRNTILNNCCRWELSPFLSTGISGALCEGEIVHVAHQNEYANCTCSLLSLSEVESSRLFIHSDALNKVTNLKYDNQHILTYLLKSTNEDMYRTNRTLNLQISAQNNQILDTLFLDSKTMLPNVARFIYDQEHNAYNKVCIITNQNNTMLRNHYGDARCNHEMLLKVQRSKDFLNDEELIFYQYNQDGLLIAAKSEYDDATFLEKIKALFSHLSSVDSSDEFYHINEFSLVINEADILDKAELTLTYIKNSTSRFLIYYPTLGLESELEEELACLSHIKYALHHDGVIPYFQAIHDNVLHNINKYESLMRIQTKDDTILMPGNFLHVAKKYKLYEELSRTMIEKVMRLFKDSTISVTINLSVQDIYSQKTKKLIYDQLHRTSTPENIIFEIVESEEIYRDQILEIFINEIHKIGAKIAIDDFGSGYNNLLKLVKLNADYIKIDGEIIRNILHDETCHKILKTILFLSKQTNTELVAEYVESDEIQKEIERFGIRFSQGFHFARPRSFEDGVKLK